MERGQYSPALLPACSGQPRLSPGADSRNPAATWLLQQFIACRAEDKGAPGFAEMQEFP